MVLECRGRIDPNVNEASSQLLSRRFFKRSSKKFMQGMPPATWSYAKVKQEAHPFGACPKGL